MGSPIRQKVRHKTDDSLDSTFPRTSFFHDGGGCRTALTSSRAGGDAALAGFVACRKRAPFFVRSWSLATDDCDASDGAAAASVTFGCPMARPPPCRRVSRRETQNLEHVLARRADALISTRAPSTPSTRGLTPSARQEFRGRSRARRRAYGECAHLDDRMASPWWARHARSFRRAAAGRLRAQRLAGLVRSGPGNSTRPTETSMHPAVLAQRSLRAASQAGWLPDLSAKPALPPCLRAPAADFALGDATAPPSARAAAAASRASGRLARRGRGACWEGGGCFGGFGCGALLVTMVAMASRKRGRASGYEGRGSAIFAGFEVRFMPAPFAIFLIGGGRVRRLGLSVKFGRYTAHRRIQRPRRGSPAGPFAHLPHPFVWCFVPFASGRRARSLQLGVGLPKHRGLPRRSGECQMGRNAVHWSRT